MIPPAAHLVWLGPRLNALGYLTARSALGRGGFASVTLHHDDPALTQDPLVRDLSGRGGFSLARLDLAALAAADAPDGLGEAAWRRLTELERALASPAIRSDLYRYALLWRHGGVYLDADVIVLKDFAPLREAAGFGGVERICFPLEVVGGVNPFRWAYAGTLTALRAAICRLSPRPSRAFRRIEGLYYLAANPAVMGAAPRHPVLRRLLRAAAALSDAEAGRPYRLGPQLFDAVVREAEGAEFVLHGPPAFYSLAPEICREYVSDDPDGRLGDTPDERAYAAHLYDSVLRLRLREPIDAAYLRRSRGRTLLARMAKPYLDDLFAATVARGTPAAAPVASGRDKGA